MEETDPRIAVWLATAAWPEEMPEIRRILLAAGLEEGWKWRGPCYMAAGGNIAMPWGTLDHCGISFFKGVLLADPAGLLVPRGPNSRSVRVAKFSGRAEVLAAEPALAALLAEAVALEASGAGVPLRTDEPDWPEELEERLAADPELAAAFAALTPGRRRGWILHFSGAKQSATRAARIGRAVPAILAGRGLHER
ncbi:YdeI family protein [Mangrovicoccus sp. HB161399]|uniref:YdeI/OmpD-associated family protein n=1 Tax=Mangrovicoccus sp. HB161399 TaxID=2720392 RepID=UPI001557C295|nr:YdeI/OmpD-associated family protein [Mangrovicoccus sp. HB161399]